MKITMFEIEANAEDLRASRSVAETLRPVRIGTSTVAPNIAKRCWRPRMSIFGVPRVLAS